MRPRIVGKSKEPNTLSTMRLFMFLAAWLLSFANQLFAQCSNDTIAPVISGLPSVVSVDYCGQNPYEPDYAGITDNCDDTLNIYYTDSIPEYTCNTIAYRTYYAEDDDGNIDTFEQEVHYYSQGDAPYFINPDAQDTLWVACQGDLYSPPAFDDPDCDFDEVTWVPITWPGFCPLDGIESILTREWTVVDYCGNSDSFVQTVFIESCVSAYIEEISVSGDVVETVSACGGEARIVADGTTSLRITVTNWWYPMGMHIWQDPTGVDPDQFGYLTLVEDDGLQAVYEYTAPQYVPGPAQERIIDLEILDLGGSFPPIYFTVKVVRPPVLLLHGLFSKGGIWKAWQNDLVTSGKYLDYQVYAPSYPNNLPFDQNIPNIKFYIDLLKASMEYNGVHCNSVDIIGHSMGPLLARYYTQTPNYSGDVNRIVSINTPHHGSPWGRKLLEYTHPYVRNVLCFFGLCLDGNVAVQDLRTDALAITEGLTVQTPASEAIPKAIVCSTISVSDLLNDLVINSQYGNSFSEFAWKYYAASIGASADALLNVAVMGGYPHDILVQLQSQTSNLTNSAVEEFSALHHMNVKDNASVQAYVMSILDEEPDAGGFFTGPYGVPTGELFENGTPLSGEMAAVSDNNRGGSFVSIFSPTAGEDVEAGTSIIVNVDVSSDIQRGLLLYMFDDHFYSQVVLDLSQPISVFIDSIVVGSIPMMVVGFNEDGYAAMDTIHLNAGPDATVLSISVAPQMIVSSESHSATYEVYGNYSDGVERTITGLAGLSINSLHGKFTPTLAGTILCLAQGVDTLVATYNGMDAMAQVNVLDSTAWVHVPVPGGFVGDCIPTINLSGMDTLYTTISADSYQWLDCNDAFSAIPGATDSLFVPSTNGLFALAITQGSCVDTSACYFVLTTRVGSYENEGGIIVPNPNNGTFSLELFEAQVNATILITDMTGRVVYREQGPRAKRSLIQLQTPAGSYMVTVTSARSRFVLPLIVR